MSVVQKLVQWGALVGVGALLGYALPRASTASPELPEHAALTREDLRAEIEAASEPLDRRLAALERGLQDLDTSCAEQRTIPSAPTDEKREIQKAAAPERVVDSEALAPVRTLLAEATSRGSWTVEDRETLREALLSASEAERFASYQTIGRAINSGALRVSIEGAPF